MPPTYPNPHYEAHYSRLLLTSLLFFHLYLILDPPKMLQEAIDRTRICTQAPLMANEARGLKHVALGAPKSVGLGLPNANHTHRHSKDIFHTVQSAIFIQANMRHNSFSRQK